MLADSDVLEEDEHDRLCALYSYQILDTAADTTFNNLLNLTAKCLAISIAFISLIDRERQWFLACLGADATEIPRHLSFCEYTILNTTVFEIPDTLADSRFSGHPMVVGEPHIRFYAGAPLIDEHGYKLGSICIFAEKPRHLSACEKEMLLHLADEVVLHLTLRKKAKQLEVDASRFQELLNITAVSTEIHCILNDAGEVLFINDAVTRLLEYTVEEAKALSLREVCDPRDLPRVVKVMEDGLSRREKEFHIDFRIVGKNGKMRWISWNIVTKNRRWYTYGRDITDSKDVESELQVLSLVASKTNTGVNIMDNEGVTTWVNHSLEKLTGYTLEELKGSQLGNILSPNYDQELIAASRSKSKNKESYAIEVLAEKKDGTPIWFEVSNTPIVNHKGKVERQIDLISDISSRKQVEREMIEAREQALKLSQAKEMFLSVMSHEIRTPLNAVIGMTHLLLDNDPKPSQIDDLNILKFSGENLLHIINDVLDFTKIETGNMELEIIPFNLRRLANDIVNSLQVNGKKNGNQLNLSFDQAIPDLMMGDKNRLYQILMNFLGNAIKFTSDGFVQLKINLVGHDEGDIIVRFVIEDTGIGIPKDKQKYIFETFTQAKADTSRKYGGSGLGLAITKKLLHMYNAEIQVESAEGEGTTFSFEIKFKKSAEIIMSNASSPEMSIFVGKRILVVDDNEINILIAKRILSKWGLTIDAAINGYEAIEKITGNTYDLVFMDINMPGIDGFETTGIIRDIEGEYYQKIPIIALTASTLKKDHFKFKACGMNGHILKPFNPEEIRNLLSDVFS